MQIQVILTGDSLMLMHADTLANPLHPASKAKKALTSKGVRKTDDDIAAISRIEWEHAMYFDAEAGPYLPTWNIKRSFQDGGRINKLGKHVERAFEPMVHVAPLVYDGPRTQNAMWDDKGQRFIDVRLAKVGTGRLPVCRPKFNGWSASFLADLDTSIMNLEDFSNVAARAGKMVGIGDFRARFGRYSVEIVAA